MRFGRRGGLKWGASPRLGGLRWYARKDSELVAAHGAYAYTGPLGAGKTILAVAHAYYYTRHRITDAAGRCVCGRAGCPAKWTVYSNMPSTWVGSRLLGQKGWAQPLDIVVQMTENFSEMDHVIILLDEAHQALEARRAQRTVNVDASYFLTHLRKRSVKLLYTSPSFDYVDSRLRDRTTRVYNCWTTNLGDNVNADVFNLAMGHVPPALRHRYKKTSKSWWTTWAKGLYDTWERITADDLLASKEMAVWMRDDDGSLVKVTVRDMVRVETELLAREGVAVVTPEEVAQRVSQTIKADIAPGLVKRYLLQEGHPAAWREDGRQEFVILAEGLGSDGESAELVEELGD